MLRFIFYLIFLFLSYNGIAQSLPRINEIPDNFTAQQKIQFAGKRSLLVDLRTPLRTRIDQFNTKCGSVPESNKVLNDQCATEFEKLSKDLKVLSDSIINFNILLEEIRIINGMNTLSQQLGWPAEEQARLDSALKALHPDGTSNTIESKRSWDSVLARGQNELLATEASKGMGPGFPGAGKQSHNDCAVYALANETGLSYSIVATRAAKLISEGSWRSENERADPQKTIENGLNGGEVIMLAEAFGQVKVIPSNDFAKTLQDGHSIMVNMIPPDGDVDLGHEVVITKTFQHDGQTWFEMIDSNQKGPWQRLYLKKDELNNMIKENGVVYSPDPGTTPKLLR